MYSFCSNQLNLSKYTLNEHYKSNLSPKNCLLEIAACNLEGPFIYFKNYSALRYHYGAIDAFYATYCNFEESAHYFFFAQV